MYTTTKQSITEYQRAKGLQPNGKRIQADRDRDTYTAWAIGDQVMLQYLLTQHSQTAINKKARRLLKAANPLVSPNTIKEQKLQIKNINLKDL